MALIPSPYSKIYLLICIGSVRQIQEEFLAVHISHHDNPKSTSTVIDPSSGLPRSPGLVRPYNAAAVDGMRCPHPVLSEYQGPLSADVETPKRGICVISICSH